MSIIVENITKTYGSQKALNDVSFQLNKGEITGFLGPNGAGKSTMMKIITGYLNPDSGNVLFDGENLNSNLNFFQSKIGYLPESTPLYPEMYIREYLQFVGGIYKLKSLNQRIDEAIELTGLELEIHKKVGALSKGYKQRVGLAQALIHNPELLILDEPTSGLDPNQLEEIRSMIVKISKEKTVLLSTHIMQEVEAICKRVIIINKGELVADGPISTLNKSLSQNQKVLFETIENIEATQFEKLDFVKNVYTINSNTILIEANPKSDIRPLLFNFAVANNYTILTLQEQEKSIENIFRELTL